jgi:DNA gyrase subunit A
VEKIADHIRAGKVPQLVDVRDESTEEIRIVLELSSRGNPQAAIAYLYKNTPLQNRFHVNLTCLVPDARTGVGAPVRLSLKEILRHFLDFRFEVVTRRLTYDLEQLLKRIHLLEAFEKIFAYLDEALAIIRASDGKRDAAEKLIARFILDTEQADAVLETRLYKLARLEIEAIEVELLEKRAEAAQIQALLDSEDARWTIVKDELTALAKVYGDRRRTKIVGAEIEIEYNAEDYITRENTVVILTRAGWLKRQRSYSEVSTIRVRDNDGVGWIFSTKTHQTVTFFTDRGKAYTMLVDDVPQTTGHGDPVTAYFDFDDGEIVVGAMCSDTRCWPPVEAVAATPDNEPEEEDGEQASVDEEPEPALQLVAVTRSGYGLRFSPTTFSTVSNKAGRYYVKLKKHCTDGKPDRVIGVFATNLTENVCLVSHGGRAIIFRVRDLRYARGRSRGVRAIQLGKTDSVLAFRLSVRRRDGLEVETNRGRQEIVRTTKYAVTKRGGKGRAILLRGFIAQVNLPIVEFHREDDDDDDDGVEPDSGPLSEPPSPKENGDRSRDQMKLFMYADPGSESTRDDLAKDGLDNTETEE